MLDNENVMQQLKEEMHRNKVLDMELTRLQEIVKKMEEKQYAKMKAMEIEPVRGMRDDVQPINTPDFT
jgi:regulator of replication initiation timing